jgi:signal transduction histidine kinase/CheY-like chemotaxis protein
VSLRTRLLLLIMLAVLLPALFVSLRFFVDRGRRIEAATGNLSVVADDLATKLNEKILGTAQLLYGLARARDLDTTDRRGCSTFLSAVRDEYPQYTGILTINPDGSLFCDSINTGRNLDLRDRKYFQQASSRNGVVVLEPVFGRLTGIAVLQVAYGVRGPSGELKFVLLASLNLEKFVSDHAQRGQEVLLLDLKGKIMAWSPANIRSFYRGTSLAQQPLFAFAEKNASGGSGEVAGIDGGRQVWAVAGLPAIRNAGLLILVGESRADLVSAANTRLAQDMIALASVALLLFLGVWLLVELGIRRQISRIVKMAQQLGAGNPQARIPPPYPVDELGGLMLVLNRMAASLEHQNAAIEDLNEKVRQAQKMEAIGHLTGGVAHDFNNMLTVILGCAEDLAEKLADNPELRKRAELVMAAADRGAGLTRSLLAFARRQPLDPKSVDVNTLVLQMENLLRRTFSEHIELSFVLGPEVALALVDPGQLETAILNLAINARDAMPLGGRLIVETGNAHLDSFYAGRNDLPAGDYVMVAVADSGTGMKPDVLARAFEPFFTTKEVGKGTGLGLSMVYGFVKQSGGHIKIYSETGHGTIVKLYLPRANTAAAALPAPQPASLPGAGEAILAVEDDDLVRAHVESELATLGYAVKAVRNGAEALEILRASGKIDLLFSDVVMPGGLSGPELAREAQLLRPGLKVLFTSGYTESTVLHRGGFDSGMQLLSKPYRRQELATKLRAMLCSGS